jgi:signal transduction histidine kinase
LIELIEGILSFARVEAGKEQVHLSDTTVGEIVEDVSSLIDPLARTRGLTLTVESANPSLRMHTDAGKVRQIVLNLLSNSVKFTPKGEVRLDVHEEAGDVVWKVRDTGVGIAPEEQARIFEPFRQVGDVHTSRAAGTGLGLSVSRQLARLLGGEVTVESALGAGSTFTLRLPIKGPTAI